MIRILQFMESLDRGGIETFIMNVLRNMDRSRYRFIFLLLREKKYEYVQEAMELGADIEYLLPADYHAPGNPVLRGREYTKYLREWLREHRSGIDIIHIQASHLQNMYPYLRVMISEKFEKIILHSHNSTHESSKIVLIHKLFRMRLGFIKTKNIACSDLAGKWMFGPHGKYTVLRNGIPLSQFQFDEEERRKVRRKLNIKDNCLAVCHVGRFHPQKNHTFLLRMFQKLYKMDGNARLFLIGTGSGMDKAKALAGKLGMVQAVSFMEGRDDVSSLLNGMDVFAFPSLYEGLSVVLVEVQANRLPVVCSNTISQETLLNNHIRMLPITPDDAAYRNWAESILRSAEEGRQNTEYKQEFYQYDISNTVSELEAIYEGMVNG